MNMVLAFVVACVFILLCAKVLFAENSRSAVALARHDLFRARDRLFQVAAQGHVGFEHRGYRAARDMLNSFIRYAHDLSLTQLVLTRALRIARGIKRPQPSAWDLAIASLPKSARSEVNEIVTDAVMTMLRLMVTRSILLSAAFMALMACRSVAVAIGRLAHRVRAKADVARLSDEVLTDLLSRRSGTQFSRVVKQEAKGYRMPGPDVRMAA